MKKVMSILLLWFLVCTSNTIAQASVEWLLSDFFHSLPENAVICGNPELIGSPYGDAVLFDGVDDGIFLDNTPLRNLQDFTIEVIMRPDKEGLAEQRFLHLGEMDGDRVMLETRLTNDGYWYLDAFIQSGEQRFILIDSTKLHPLGEWYKVALVNKNGEVEVFINGETEFKGKMSYVPFTGGKTSIGVRQNKVYWYKGAFYKIRITPSVISPNDFMSH
ncbi:LamG-like jellyroll fold domain-containing protein [Bacteroidota bacterium]